MRIITAIKIKGLRSVQNDKLEDVGALTALVGKNSSGKSNILRGLNLFFNDEIEPGKSLVLQRDFHSRPQARKKKEITVSVDFSLPATFNFRQGLRALKDAIGDRFTITKRWELSAQKETVLHVDVTVDGHRRVRACGEIYAVGGDGPNIPALAERLKGRDLYADDVAKRPRSDEQRRNAWKFDPLPALAPLPLADERADSGAEQRERPAEYCGLLAS